MIRGATILWLFSVSAALSAAAQQSRGTTMETLVARGVEALKAARLDEAEILFRQAIEHGGAPALVHHNLGVIRQQRGDHKEAVLRFRQAARLQAGNGETHLLLGVSLLALGRNAEAASALERAVKLLPKEEQARRQLARAYQRTGNWLGVVEQYQTLSESKPQDAEYAYQLGRAYTRLSEWCYQRMIAINPDAARLHQALGQQYLAQGKYDLAMAEYRRAAEVDPRLPEIHLALAVILLELKNYEEAGKEIAIELQLAPESRKALEIKQKIEAAKLR